MITHRAFSTIVIKAVDDDARVIEGMATTPTPDRVGDVVEPLGVKFSLPLPLLWQHRSDQPVGNVIWAKATKDGIKFRASFPKMTEPGKLKDRLDEAWQSVKTGLVRAVSIGFSAVERSIMENGGYRFIKWNWLELSLVTIPANADATIDVIRAAFGSPSGHPSALGTRNPKTGKVMKTLAERISELEGRIAPKRLRMKTIIEAAAEDSERDLNESEAEEFDGLTDEVKELETSLRRLKALDTSAATAKAVSGRDADDASAARAGRVNAEPKVKEEKGVGLARLVTAFAIAKGDPGRALEIVKSRYPNMGRDLGQQIQTVLKAQIAGATTTDPSWAAPLVTPDNLISEFVEYLRPLTIIGQFGVGGIPSLRRIPFNVQFPAQVTGGEGYWVGEGQPKPLTRFSFEQIVLRWTKVANIAVLSEELIRFSTPSAELLVRNALAEALQSRMDQDFINPAITLIANVRPASITNGATTSASSGVDADAVRADLRTLLSPFIAANISTASIVLVMRQAQALSLSLMRNALGQREFPEMTLNGGSLNGIPVIVSQYTPVGVVVAVIASEIYLADDGGFAIDLSREASLEMADAAGVSNAISDLGSPPVSVEAAMVSMFQTNSVAIRAERFINWQRRRSAAVAYLTGVGWGNEVTSPPQPAI